MRSEIMRGALWHHQPKRAATLAALAWCLLSTAPFDVSAQQLPIQYYKVGDGLAHNQVHHIYQDHYSYLWISTSEGLSRFDGYRFINYDRRDGLGDQVINFVTEDRRGRLWVATNGGGVARLDEERGNARHSSQPKFVSYLVDKDLPEANLVNGMVFDADNAIWCMTDAGLFHGWEDSTGNLTFELIEKGTQPILHSPVLADSRGELWFGLKKKDEEGALIIRVVSGQVFKYALTSDPDDDVTAICEDMQGHLLAATLNSRILEFQQPPGAPERGRWAPLPLKLTAHQRVINLYALYPDTSGTLWLGTNSGLVKYRDGQQTVYTTAQGLSDMSVGTITADREGNLWLGTTSNGLCKLSSEQITNFTTADGMPDYNVQNIFESRSGAIYVFPFTCCAVKLIGDRVTRVPGSESQLFNALWPGQILLDRGGDWWFVTESGLYRFHGPELQFRRGEKMNAALGFPEHMSFFRIFEISEGRVWLTTSSGVVYELELQPRPRVVRQFLLRDLNDAFTQSPIAMLRDNRGALWLTTRVPGLGRLFEGTLKQIGPAEGLPETAARALFQDSRGWFWIGLRNEGVSVINNPEAEPLRFVNYSTAQKLTSNSVWSITEDDFGRIYLATGKGLAQIDLGMRRTRILGTADGLAGDNLNLCFKDSQGRIWVATNGGVSRLSPRPPEPAVAPPPVYLSRVYVAGEELDLPERGMQSISYFELAASHNNLVVEYVAVNFRGGTPLRYQYKLEGVDEEWSVGTDQRTVNYARLAPGKYRFLVRAVNEAGLTSAGPAQIDFRILLPLYLRWWFITAVAMALAMTAYLLYRLRVRRLIEIEKVRTRIATDLHDDVGANASLVAMLSEVAWQQAARGDAKALNSLTSIAGIARELIDSTSDIVWAVNPRKDRMSELIKRMRRFASDALGSRGVALRFTVRHHEHDLPLGADARREIFFIFKESVNNIARHAGCSETEIILSVENGRLTLKLNDNGKGFNPSEEFEGNGLQSIRDRARKLGAELSIVSHPASGCETTLVVPLRHRRLGWWTRNLPRDPEL